MFNGSSQRRPPKPVHANAPHKEDTQPNEGINKRLVGPVPPAIQSTTPQTTRGSPFGRGRSWRGRSSHPASHNYRPMLKYEKCPPLSQNSAIPSQYDRTVSG
jgi:hypothetical protein